MRGIADTGVLVAFANRNDRHHQWAVGVAEQVSEPLVTCEAVLAETGVHLRSVSAVLAMLQEGLIALAFDCREPIPQLAALAQRFADRRPDLADLRLGVLVECEDRGLSCDGLTRRRGREATTR